VIAIHVDDPTRADVRQLLDEHLVDMYATSPAESVHALDPVALAEPNITLWTAREDSVLLGCAALLRLSPKEGEIKSMRTTNVARGRGVASMLLGRILDEARTREFERISLETGSEEFFAPARRLYRRHGFTPCPPFSDYQLDPNSVFMTLWVGRPEERSAPV
jgi:putative acetyltransferase